MLFKREPIIKLSEINKDIQLLDVREKYEFNLKSIKGAINVPLSQISTYSISNLVYVCCQSGMRSKKAVKILRKMELKQYA